MGSYPTGNQKFQKNSKKNQKFRKHHHTFLSSKNRMGKAEQERKKKKKSFRWVPTRPGIANSKKIAKQFKNLENTIIPSFQVKIRWERPRKRENKKNHSDGFLPFP